MDHHDPREYLAEIRRNLEKLKDQGGVSETERALFGMIDGMAGMMHHGNERVTAPGEAGRRPDAPAQGLDDHDDDPRLTATAVG